ncbi:MULTISPECIES: Crp/Fnr family transcriptional regulator [unclassified Acinetobacter]|uniref:Crp/Fnr family transcriptional regulator n=1 Tax=unclassified Acinetobacter TaxID=196816 RepID=UPI0015D39A81|nr:MULTISPECIES: Crp/Fnr family transcriptional regulator [unclassified Acinetobacter]
MKIHTAKNNVDYDILKNIFKNISEDKLDYILKYSTIRKYQKGDLILNKENCHTALYILLDGIIQIGYLSPSGRFHAFNYFSEKHLINLLPCLNTQVIDYDYYAFNQVKVLQIPQHIFIEEINDNNYLKQDALNILSHRMQYLIQQVKFLQVANLHQKVCKVLHDLSIQYGRSHPLGTEIKLKISQHDLADLLSASRQTINKEIKNLASQNILDWQYENIVIKDKEYLNYQIKWI